MSLGNYGNRTKEYTVFTPQFRAKAYNQMNFSHQHGQRVIDDYFRIDLSNLENAVAHDLNVYERRHPRKDPLMYFDTDWWHVECRMIYVDRSRSTLEVSATNYQDPYRYPGKGYMIGNLAAVKLDQTRGVVEAQKYCLRWWYDGKYIYRPFRNKSGAGHKRYKSAIDNILDRNVRKML